MNHKILNIKILSVVFLFSFAKILAQDGQIKMGQWRMHLPMSSPIGVALTNEFAYTWATQGFSRFHFESKEVETLSKINGYTNFEVSFMAYSKTHKALMIAYQDSRFDLKYDDGKLYTNDDIMRSSIVGLKSINHINIKDNFAFLSCDFGIHVFNLESLESSATYLSQRFSKVNASTIFQNRILAAATDGVYEANLPTSGISVNPGAWTLNSNLVLKNLANHENFVYGIAGDVLWRYNGFWQAIDSNKGFQSLSVNENKLIVTTEIGFYIYDKNQQVTFRETKGANSAIIDSDGKIWYTSNGTGLISLAADGTLGFHSPGGPYNSKTGKMIGKNGSLWVTGGLAVPTGGPTYSLNGYYRFKDGLWFNSITARIPVIDTIRDFHAIASDPFTDDVWIAGYYQGLYRIRNDKVIAVFDDQSSPLELSSSKYITSLAFDKRNNLWVGNFGATNALAVKTPSNEWNTVSLGSSNRVLEVTVDNSNQKWIRLSSAFGSSFGLAVYDDNGTPLNTNDDKGPRFFNTSVGSGALPDNKVNCVTVDRDGRVWVGTDKGLCVFFSPGSVLGNNPADARQIVVEEGDNLGYLLGDDIVTAIYVDGGNRKWIATRSGLWLVAPDGRKVLEHYNAGNSPLLSNNIQHIAMIEETGELFLSTDKGIVSLRTDASAGGNVHGDVIVFPNPVKPNFDGMITIQGLPQDAYVKITDIAGNLIYETKANGGTATWNGRNHSGRRGSSGVYLIFTSNKDGSDTFVSKLLLVN
jgi:ligand-binding sensor domain-containing protein